MFCTRKMLFPLLLLFYLLTPDYCLTQGSFSSLLSHSKKLAKTLSSHKAKTNERLKRFGLHVAEIYSKIETNDLTTQRINILDLKYEINKHGYEGLLIWLDNADIDEEVINEIMEKIESKIQETNLKDLTEWIDEYSSRVSMIKSFIKKFNIEEASQKELRISINSDTNAFCDLKRDSLNSLKELLEESDEMLQKFSNLNEKLRIFWDKYYISIYTISARLEISSFPKVAQALYALQVENPDKIRESSNAMNNSFELIKYKISELELVCEKSNHLKENESIDLESELDNLVQKNREEIRTSRELHFI